MRYLLILVTLGLGCGRTLIKPPEYDYNRTCTSKTGVTVYFRAGAHPNLECTGFEEHEDRVLAAFTKYGLNVKRLLERLPYTRIVVYPEGENPMPGVKGYTICDAALVATISTWFWDSTAIAHEYAHLAQDCVATQNPNPFGRTEPYKDHENWCGGNVWKAVAEARGDKTGGSSCVY